MEEYKHQDPIEGVRKMILTNKWASEEDLEAMDVVAKNEVEEAVKFAESSPLPSAEELYNDVYKTPDYPFIKD